MHLFIFPSWDFKTQREGKKVSTQKAPKKYNEMSQGRGSALSQTATAARLADIHLVWLMEATYRQQTSKQKILIQNHIDKR